MAGEDNFRYALDMFGLDPGAGYDTAAKGARAAQTDANNLSNLQWQRQMAGLGEAQGYTNQLQGLYNSMYSPGGGAPAAGGLGSLGAGPSGGGAPAGGAGMLLTPPTTPEGREQGQVEKDFADWVPGASFGSLKEGHYGDALKQAIPTGNAIYQGGKKLWNKVF